MTDCQGVEGETYLVSVCVWGGGGVQTVKELRERHIL